MRNHTFVEVDEALLKEFLKSIIEGAANFRYYKTRPLNIIHNHLACVILKNDKDKPVAYGHLEKDGAILWLGLAVGDSYKRLGYGTCMLQQLIKLAKIKQEKSITLAVDKSNKAAQDLYAKFGFEFIEQRDQVIICNLLLS